MYSIRSTEDAAQYSAHLRGLHTGVPAERAR